MVNATDKKYNGWANYETWLVKLWLDNDQGEQEYMNELARENREAYDLAEVIKDYIENQASEILPNAGLFTELLNSAISEVDWIEIAEAFIEDNPIDEDEDY
jgi:hypothetical protein